MGLKATVRQWQSSWARAHELDALGSDQREALARDIGIPGDVLANLVARKANVEAQLPRLMNALSLDVEQIRRSQAALMRDMSVTCTQCASVSRCQRELDRRTASSVYGEYCPNAETLRELHG